MATEQYIQYKGGEIYFTDKGKGRAIVFLHGFLQNKEVWNKFTTSFPKRYRIICIDLPAHGHSSTYGYFNSMSHMADAVKAVLDALNLKKYVLIGHSMGGYVCLAFGEKYTDHLLAMVLMNSTAQADSVERKKSRAQMKQLIPENKERIVHLLIPDFFNRNKRNPYKQVINKLISTAMKMSHQSIISSIEGMKRRKESEIIVKYAPYPVLYLIGEKDQILDSEQLISESRLAEDGQFVLLEDVGHMAMFEAEETSRKSILQFLTGIKS